MRFRTSVLGLNECIAAGGREGEGGGKREGGREREGRGREGEGREEGGREREKGGREEGERGREEGGRERENGGREEGEGEEGGRTQCQTMSAGLCPLSLTSTRNHSQSENEISKNCCIEISFSPFLSL